MPKRIKRSWGCILYFGIDIVCALVHLPNFGAICIFHLHLNDFVNGFSGCTAYCHCFCIISCEIETYNLFFSKNYDVCYVCRTWNNSNHVSNFVYKCKVLFEINFICVTKLMCWYLSFGLHCIVLCYEIARCVAIFYLAIFIIHFLIIHLWHSHWVVCMLSLRWSHWRSSWRESCQMRVVL